MASRRTRIKGLANIPQRRKPTIINAEQNEVVKEKVEETKDEQQSQGTNNEANVEVPSTLSTTQEAIIEIDLNLKNNESNSIENISSIQVHIEGTNVKESDHSDHVTEIPKSPIQLASKECNLSTLGITRLSTNECGEDYGVQMITDCENRPPPATSPSKFLNRTRIKAVPRLGHQRRISINLGSASESEDDSRKTNKRVRNDSICSSVSNFAESPAVDVLPKKKKTEFNTVIQRKCRRTEQSRKLAEARREFQNKFNNGKPDKQQLTMIDLLFYNPATAPMSQKQQIKRRTESTTEETAEDVDNPEPVIKEVSNEEVVSDSDEENLVPAPQIKIGDDGEIIVDEKSLVIENKELRRERQNIKNSQLVDGDTNTTYGIYNRVKRAKDWSKEETLRFYKVLNTIGTDFTLMGEVFPERSRRELKMKFKKEERVNRALVDRAIMQPIQFDIEELRKDLDELDYRKKEKERLQKEKVERKKEKKIKEKNVQRKRAEKPPRKQRCIRKPSDVEENRLVIVEKDIGLQLKNGINSLLDNDSEDEQPLSQLKHLSTTTMTPLPPPPQPLLSPTRPPPPQPLLSPTPPPPILSPSPPPLVIDEDAVESQEEEEEKEEEEEEDYSHIDPGSLIITTTQNEKGETVQTTWTVDIDGKKVLLDLPSNVVDRLSNDKSNKSNDEDNSVLQNNNCIECEHSYSMALPPGFGQERRDKK